MVYLTMKEKRFTPVIFGFCSYENLDRVSYDTGSGFEASPIVNTIGWG